MNRVRLLPLVLAALLVSSLPAGANGVTEVSDTLSVIKEDDAPSNVEVALALAEATPLRPQRVLIGRDDEFVDSMTAGVLQGDSPLLLVPPQGPVPDEVLTMVGELGASSVTLLGGEQALSASVEQAFADAGLGTARRAGASRFETAIAIAEDAGASDTVIIARAYADAGSGDPTQAFADSLAAGGMAAEFGWPILLTDTTRLSTPTREWLDGRGISTALVLGGTAAISQQVDSDLTGLGIAVERVAGPDRFSTAIAIAGKRGADSAADVDRVTLVDGQGADAWAGGFAAAAHSALFDAPIVLGTPERLPGPTGEWLGGGAGGFAQPSPAVRLTCVIASDVCEEGRVELGLPPRVPVNFSPPTGSSVAPGSTINIQAGTAGGTIIGGSCVTDTPAPIPADGNVQLPEGDIGSMCDILLSFDLGGGVTQTETAQYRFGTSFVGLALVSSNPDGEAVGGQYPDIAEDGGIVFVSDGDPMGMGISGAHIYAFRGVPQIVDVSGEGTPSTVAAMPSFNHRPRISASGRHVIFTSADPGLDGSGSQGNTTSNVYLRDLEAQQTRLVSVDASGAPVSAVGQSDVSADGAIAVYHGDGVGPTGTDSRQLFIHDLASGSIDVLRNFRGEPFLNADIGALALSQDGRTLVFASARPDLIEVDTNARQDVFAYTLPTDGQASGRIERISVSSQGAQSTGDRIGSDTFVAVTSEGQQAAFTSGATNLDGTGDDDSDIFVRDIPGQRTTLVSRANAAGSHLGNANRPDISGGGRFVTFISDRVPFGSQATGPAGCGVYRVDQMGGTLRLDVGPDGSVNAGTSCSLEQAAVSESGIVVMALQSPMLPEDGNDLYDIYLGVGVS